MARHKVILICDDVDRYHTVMKVCENNDGIHLESAFVLTDEAVTSHSVPSRQHGKARPRRYVDGKSMYQHVIEIVQNNGGREVPFKTINERMLKIGGWKVDSVTSALSHMVLNAKSLTKTENGSDKFYSIR